MARVTFCAANYLNSKQYSIIKCFSSFIEPLFKHVCSCASLFSDASSCLLIFRSD